VTAKIPAALWEQILDSLEIEVMHQVLDCRPGNDASISKTALKKALEGGAVVPGAKLIDDRYVLVRKP
jgi:hypothetical protein